MLKYNKFIEFLPVLPRIWYFNSFFYRKLDSLDTNCIFNCIHPSENNPMLFACDRMYYEYRWLTLYSKTDLDEKSTTEAYNNLYSHLYHYPQFVYAVVCSLNGNASKSDSLYITLQHKINNYDTQLLHADNALTLHHYVFATDAFTKAHLMVPNRFMPLYGLMQTYIQQGDTIQAQNIARQIVVKNIKIKISEIDMIKYEAKKFL